MVGSMSISSTSRGYDDGVGLYGWLSRIIGLDDDEGGGGRHGGGGGGGDGKGGGK